MNNQITEKDSKEEIIGKLALSWNESGIEKGDTVLIHSALSGFLKRYREKNINITPDDVLDSFLLSVGDKGTLVFPTFNFEFTKGKAFDVRNTVSETGILTETARKRSDSVRSAHPLFSFTITGFLKDRFGALTNFTAYGTDSPFALIHELNAKIAALDIGGEYCNTFLHYIEHMENAPNRFHKIFRGPYIDANGNKSIREFELYARKLELNVITDVKPMEDILWSKGLYSGYPPGEGSCLHVINANTLYDETAKFIREGKSLNLLYRLGKKD